MSAGPGLPSVEAVLTTLRRGQRQLARNPRAAVETAVKQLLALGGAGLRAGGAAESADGAAHGGEGQQGPTYRIDDLAHVSGVTVRNIRAYQERGLLPAPRRQGRTALFDHTHLSRLKIISSMLDRGYTAANILEMIGAWEAGRDLGEVLGLEGALVPPVVDQPVNVTVAEARRRAGGARDFDLLVEAGLIERTGGRTRLLRPRLLDSFAEMREHGMSTEALVEVFQQVAPSADRIAETLVTAGAAELAPRFVGEEPPTSAEVAELVELLTRFRALAMTSVTATLAISIEVAIEKLLTDYLAETVLGSLPTEETG